MKYEEIEEKISLLEKETDLLLRQLYPNTKDYNKVNNRILQRYKEYQKEQNEILNQITIAYKQGILQGQNERLEFQNKQIDKMIKKCIK